MNIARHGSVVSLLDGTILHLTHAVILPGLDNGAISAFDVKQQGRVM